MRVTRPTSPLRVYHQMLRQGQDRYCARVAEPSGATSIKWTPGNHESTTRCRHCSAWRNVQTILDTRLFCWKFKLHRANSMFSNMK